MTPFPQNSQSARSKEVTVTGRLVLACLALAAYASNAAIALEPTDSAWRWQTARMQDLSDNVAENDDLYDFTEFALLSHEEDAQRSHDLELYDANSAQGCEKTQFFSILGKCYQGLDLTLDYLPTQDASGYFGLNASTKFGLPSPVSGHFILISPTLGYHDLDAPAMRHINNDKIQLYSLGGGISYVMPHSERWLYTLSVNGAYNGDGRSSDKDSVNISTVGLAIFTPSDQWKWFLGACYATSASTKILPFLGAVWAPNDQWRVDFLFPEPKVAKRIEFLQHNPDETYWLSVGGGMGAFQGVFDAIPHASQATTRHDVKAEYRDFRVFTELERQAAKFQYRCQLGVAFARKIELEAREGPYWFETSRPGAAVYFKTKVHF